MRTYPTLSEHEILFQVTHDPQGRSLLMLRFLLPVNGIYFILDGRFLLENLHEGTDPRPLHILCLFTMIKLNLAHIIEIYNNLCRGTLPNRAQVTHGHDSWSLNSRGQSRGQLGSHRCFYNIHIPGMIYSVDYLNGVVYNRGHWSVLDARRPPTWRPRVSGGGMW